MTLQGIAANANDNANGANDALIMRGTNQPTEEEEQQQQIVPVYELLLSSDDSPSASLRVASVPDDQRVDIRCAIAMESTHAFIPGTLTLHKNGKRVGTTADDGTVFTRRTVTVENSLNYNFVPWHRRTKPSGQSVDDVIILGKESNEQKTNWQKQRHSEKEQLKKRGHHRAKKHKTKSNSSSVFSSSDHSVIFHCSALARPSEARRRGRVPRANLYQRTLKMTRSIGADSSPPNAVSCPMGISPRRCLNGGVCVQQTTDAADKHFCQCAKGFDGRNCERATTPRGIVPNSAPFVLCVSFLLVAFFLFVAVAFGLALFREKRRKRSRTMKTTINRLEDINENSAQTPFEQIYEAADYLREQSPIPTIYSTMSNGQKTKPKMRIYSEGGGYDNLEKLREEIRRQKAELEGKRRKGKETEDSEQLAKGKKSWQLKKEAPNWAPNANGTTEHNEEFVGWTKC
ncbi:hypothetical protein niasHT_037716 [Heterodera trifolii]|uniref:EGF-like domain-containing protein n=1 Tax=Heterodera trifolii TaxID=157864 RepID=A0ABD2J7L8_9BILA